MGSASDARAVSAEDALLAERAAKGERTAQAEIYETHRRAVGRHVLAHTRDPATTDDLVQDTFIIAFERMDRFNAQSTMKTWLLGIAINVVRNHRRKTGRRRSLLDRVLGNRHVRDDPGTLADTADLQSRADRALRAALDQLAEAQREAFVLRVLEEVPLATCSQLLGAPVATISYRARKADASVRAYLATQGFGS